MWFACAGALAYCSWPLAFLVNPSLAGNGLASSFEAPSQPFSWLFILLDCIAGLCITVVCIRELRAHRGFLRQSRAFSFALLGYATFGLATVTDAVVPLRCGSGSVQVCASQIWPLTPDDVLTGVAMAALCLAATTLAVDMTKRSPALPSGRSSINRRGADRVERTWSRRCSGQRLRHRSRVIPVCASYPHQHLGGYRAIWCQWLGTSLGAGYGVSPHVGVFKAPSRRAGRERWTIGARRTRELQAGN